jgi:hypothetical protein
MSKTDVLNASVNTYFHSIYFFTQNKLGIARHYYFLLNLYFRLKSALELTTRRHLETFSCKPTNFKKRLGKRSIRGSESAVEIMKKGSDVKSREMKRKKKLYEVKLCKGSKSC